MRGETAPQRCQNGTATGEKGKLEVLRMMVKHEENKVNIVGKKN